MRKPLISLSLIVLALAGVLTVSLATAATPASRTVKVGDNWFYSKSGVPGGKMNVKRNTTVKFKIVEGVHDVWGYPNSNAKYASEALVPADPPFKYKMTKLGTFKIFCNIHGKDVQSMKIVVKK